VSEPARELFAEAYPVVVSYVDLLANRGVEWGLVGPREVDRLWDRHILNSVAVADLIPQGSAVADIGSGAGLPGIPLALLRPDLRLDLVEPLLRRSSFLTQAVDQLGITGRVRVVRTRAEDLRETYDVVLSRALAPLSRLIEWCAPIRARDGVILALKGSSAPDEVQKFARALSTARLTAEVLTVRAHPGTDPTTVVRLSAS
jgi:16S rRNA (guanine527-N7)-methyltransferase